MAKVVEFVPECWADTGLMLALLDVPNERALVNHAQGISSVGKILRDENGLRRGRRMVGMVDNDRKFAQQKYLAEFTTVVVGALSREDLCKEDLHCILQHPAHPEQFLIVLNPACDTWLLRAAQQAGIPLAELGIPSDLEGFKKISKRNGITPNEKMEDLLRRIQVARPPIFQELADFVASVLEP